jgi:hypothetical protein
MDCQIDECGQEAVVSLLHWPVTLNEFKVRLNIQVCQGHFDVFRESSRAMPSSEPTSSVQPKLKT